MMPLPSRQYSRETSPYRSHKRSHFNCIPGYPHMQVHTCRSTHAGTLPSSQVLRTLLQTDKGDFIRGRGAKPKRNTSCTTFELAAWSVLVEPQLGGKLPRAADVQDILGTSSVARTRASFSLTCANSVEMLWAICCGMTNSNKIG